MMLFNQEQARLRRVRVVRERAEKARSVLRAYYNYGGGEEGSNLATAFVDLLVDVYHLTETERGELDLEEAVKVALQLYAHERAAAVVLPDPPSSPEPSS